MIDERNHETMDMPNLNFPLKVHRHEGAIAISHWHEHAEMLLFHKGKALVQCNKDSFTAGRNSLVIVNCNDMHSVEKITPEICYDCVIFDVAILGGGSADIMQEKYVTPLLQNGILFENHIENDRILNGHVAAIVREYAERAPGYELAVKSELFRITSILYRNYISRKPTAQEADMRKKNRQRFETVFHYIENHYAEKITVEKVAEAVNLSSYYFCSLFRAYTGMSFIDYLNNYRIRMAEQLLSQGEINITETALSCGFNDVNYFSRMYRRYTGLSPSEHQKSL